MPPAGKSGWAYADCIVGDGWSIAYRVLDAQYWGVPQRRRRIALIADFAGERAGEILFEREGLSRNSETCGTQREAASANAERSVGTDDCTRNCLTPWDVQSRRIFTYDGQWPALYGGEGGGHGYCMMPCIAYSFDSLASNSMKSSNPHSGCRQVEVSKTLDCFDPSPAKNQGGIAVLQPVMCCSAGFKAGQGAKSRSIGWEEEVSPCLAAEAGGNSVPIDTTQVSSPQNGCNPKWGDPCHPLAAQGHPPTVICKCYDARGNGDGQTVSTLTGDHENRITDYTSVVCEPIPIHDKATRYKGGGLTRNGDGAGNGLGVGKSGDPCPTLSTCDHHMVCYCMAHGQANAEILEDKSPCLNCNSEQPIVFGREVYNSGMNATGAHYIEVGGPSPTLRASGPHGVCVQYIVRRLTPTECARLQGFPDCWGHIDHKDDFTDEEYRFWLDVRNTHASINGKTVKEYTKAQMLTWYNKLHTDSAEYKMWGNGVALPFVRFPISRMAALGAKTLGSLFDGSGGFPLAGVLEGITPLWASEIEPYPIAVTVSRFKCG